MAPVPTNLVLDVKADYHPEGDSVLVVVFLMDPELDMGFPGYVKTGVCTLLHKGQAIRRIEFDKRFGNGAGAEGDFVFQFLHPPVTSGMQIKVEISAPFPGHATFDVQRVVPVTKGTVSDIPLSQVPPTGDDTNQEIRSVARKDELI